MYTPTDIQQLQQQLPSLSVHELTELRTQLVASIDCCTDPDLRDLLGELLTDVRAEIFECTEEDSTELRAELALQDEYQYGGRMW